MGIADVNVEVEFPYRREEMFAAICDALRGLGPSFLGNKSGMELLSADELGGHILIKAGASMFSWGKTISVSLTEPSAGRTRVVVTSAPKVGFLGGELDFGKNRRNVEDLLRETSKVMRSRQPVQPADNSVPPPPPPRPATPQIYLLREGQQRGPHSLEDMQRWFEEGAISPDDLIWYDGLAGWTPLRQFLTSEA